MSTKYKTRRYVGIDFGKKISMKKIRFKPMGYVNGKAVTYRDEKHQAESEPITESVFNLAFPLSSWCYDEICILRLERVAKMCGEKINFGFCSRFGVKTLMIAEAMLNDCINGKISRRGCFGESEKCNFEDRARDCIHSLKVAIVMQDSHLVKIKTPQEYR